MIRYRDVIRDPEILKVNKDDTYRERSEKRIVKKKILKIQLAGLAAIFTIAGVTIQKIASESHKVSEGKKIIESEFDSIFDDVVKDNGFNIALTSNAAYRPDGNVPFYEKIAESEMVEMVVDYARGRGYSEAEIYAGIRLSFGKEDASSCGIGDRSETYRDVCYKAYYDSKSNEYKKNIEEKGKSK